MGRDSRTQKIVNGFSFRVDLDHKGSFRGNQAMGNGYRGWHYHVEHDSISQETIKRYFEYVVRRKIRAKRIYKDAAELGIGFVHQIPTNFSFWELRDPTYRKGAGKFEFRIESCVLWIGQFGKLHIEANKATAYVYSILKKSDIIRILENCPTEKIIRSINFTNQTGPISSKSFRAKIKRFGELKIRSICRNPFWAGYYHPNKDKSVNLSLFLNHMKDLAEVEQIEGTVDYLMEYFLVEYICGCVFTGNRFRKNCSYRRKDYSEMCVPHELARRILDYLQ